MRLPTLDSPATARLTLRVVVLALAANMIFNVFMTATGHIYPYTNMFMVPTDRFADFFKLLGHFDGTIHGPSLTWSIEEHVRGLFVDARRFVGTNINPFHMFPLSIMLTVLTRRLIEHVDPILVFVSLLSGGLFFLTWRLRAAAVAPRAPAGMGEPVDDHTALLLALAGLLSYPTLFMADRGHFFSLVTGIATIVGVARMVRLGRMDWKAGLAFAIALNMRPNVVLIPGLAALALDRPERLRASVREMALLGLATVAMIGVTMAIAHALYPGYDFNRWHRGLAEWRDAYVNSPVNIGFTDSFDTLMRVLFHKFTPTMTVVMAMLGGAAAALAALLAWLGRLRASEAVFLGMAIAALVVPGFSDYHLMALAVVPLLECREGGVRGAGGWITLAATLFVLVPKNYVYGDDYFYTPWSYQVFVNPLVLTLAVVALLIVGFRRDAAAAAANGASTGETSAIGGAA